MRQFYMHSKRANELMKAGMFDDAGDTIICDLCPDDSRIYDAPPREVVYWAASVVNSPSAFADTTPPTAERILSHARHLNLTLTPGEKLRSLMQSPAGRVLGGPAPSSVLGGVTPFTPTGEGRKDDVEKVRYDLLPPDALHGIAEILTFGAKKYGDRNWEKGMKWGRVYRAALGHLFDWWRGARPDLETGKSHLWHAGCCLLFLISYEARGIGEDDRPKSPPAT